MVPARSAEVTDHMFGWNNVATVASHPAAQEAKAGNPFDETTPGMGAPLVSVIRPVLKGLYAAVLLVDPPSAACHWSRSVTFAAVTGALRPWSTQSSQPGGRGVSLLRRAAPAQLSAPMDTHPDRPAVARAERVRRFE